MLLILTSLTWIVALIFGAMAVIAAIRKENVKFGENFTASLFLFGIAGLLTIKIFGLL